MPVRREPGTLEHGPTNRGFAWSGKIRFHFTHPFFLLLPMEFPPYCSVTAKSEGSLVGRALPALRRGMVGDAQLLLFQVLGTGPAETKAIELCSHDKQPSQSPAVVVLAE
jgi:hypothetical protein